MRMVLVVVVEPSGELAEYRGGVGQRVHAQVVALEGLHEGLAQAVALRARHRREARHEVELGCE